MPVLNLLLPFAMTGRSLGWGVLLAVPPLNMLVWALVWGEVFAAAGRRAWLGLLMAVPGPNLVLPAYAAGEPPRRIAAALVLAAASLGGAWAARSGMDASWLTAQGRALRDADVAPRRAAARALADARGAEAALPALTAALRDGDAEVRAQAAQAIERLGPKAAPAAADLRDLLAREPQPEVRARVARALSAVGGHGDGARGEALVAGLLEAARGTGERAMPDVALVDALAAAGPSAPPLLADALQDPDPGVRWHTAAAFMHIGHRAHAVAPALLAAMDDPVWTVRNASGRALEDVATAADVPLLARALGDPSAETRYHVARALARTGPGAAPAVPALVAALSDEDWEVRLESARALGAVGTAAKSAFAALAHLLHGDREPQVRVAAAFSLAVVEPGEPADEALRRALDDPVPEVKRAARAARGWRERARASPGH